jgi:endonuclease-8
MPEGDTIAYAAKRIRSVLEGRVPDEILTPHPRHRMDRWPERLAGRAVTEIRTHGKHLFIRFGPLAIPARQDRADRMSSGSFDGELVIHSHLRMSGSWGVYGDGRRWRRSPGRAWLILRSAGHHVVQFDGPLLELLTEGRARFDQRLAALGPDVLAPEFDFSRFLARLRSDDPTRGIGDAVLDQRNLAGIGNIWKAEGCWEAGIDPWRRVADVSDAEAMAIVEGARPRMQRSASTGRFADQTRVYRHAGRPCPRCGTRIEARGQGDDNRTTFWCPGCQR